MKSPIILCLVFLLASCGGKSSETENEIRPVKYEPVTLTVGIKNYGFSGVVKAQNETNLSFKVAGTLASVHIKSGAKVMEGQIIATIDPADYAIQTNQALAQKDGAIANAKAAEAQLVNAQSTYNRVAQLYENNSLSLSEYQQAKAGLDAAQAQYDAAMSQVKTSDQQLMAASNQELYTRLLSPMDGVITAVQVEANEVVNAGTPIVKVSSLGRPEVEVGVPEALINKLKMGQAATIQFPSLPGQVFEAEVVEIAFASEKSTTYPIKLKIKNAAENIRPGMTAQVDFRVGTASEITGAKTIIAPVKSIASATDGNYAFKLMPDGEEGLYVVKRVRVDLGEITEEGYLIKQGLHEGDLVAVAGLRSLYDGRKVKLLQD